MRNEVIKALCNPVRLKIIQCLAHKDKSVSEIISNCNLAQSAVSQHLSKLKSTGLVEDHKEGRLIIYSLTNKKLTQISTLILNLNDGDKK